jgi:hypothetical protein
VRRWQRQRFGAQRQGAARPFHGVQRVEDQIRHHLAQLEAIRTHQRQVVTELEHQVGLGFDGGMQQAQGRRHLRVDLQSLDRKASAPRVRQHLFAQLRGFSGEAADFGQATQQRRRRVAGQLAPSNLGVANHAAEQVVEVVSDAARHDGQALQSLAPLQLSLQIALAALGNDALAEVANRS